MVTGWTPDPKEWEGSDAFVIGGGPSLRGFDHSRLKGRNTIGCNSAYKLGADIVKLCLFVDLSWYDENERGLRKYTGRIVTNHPGSRRLQDTRVLFIPRAEDEKLSTKGLAFGTHGNCGSAALNLALVLGARRVFLLGIDCSNNPQGEHHWHDFYEGPPKEPSALYRKFNTAFEYCAASLPTAFPGRQVINLNPRSEVTVFPFGDVDEVLPKQHAV